MRKERLKLVADVTPLFRTAEASTDLAAADAAMCLAGMLRGRVEANLPIGIGAEMIGKMKDALVTVINAREIMLAAHELTPATVRHMGIERAFGDGSPCPPTDPKMDDNVISITAAG